MNILVTGCAGFIGFHLCEQLSKNKKNFVVGIDNLNSYYDVRLKRTRLKQLNRFKNFQFNKIDIQNKNQLEKVFKIKKYKIVIHLAAQAGVRYSIDHPESYISSNLMGFYNIIDVSRKNKISKFLYASSSSVYGSQKKFPSNEMDNTNNPLSLYAATKKSNELIAHSYFNIYGFKSIALRFFTVYGPYGRPDMSLFKFTKSIYENKKIELFNRGNHTRDFTYVSDVVTAIIKLTKLKKFNFEIFNISSSNPQPLKYFLKIIEKEIGKKAKINYKKMQLGDVLKTHGNSNKLKKYTGFAPKVNINEGISLFINWYKKYYNINEKK